MYIKFRRDPRNWPYMLQFREWLLNMLGPEDKTLALGARYLAHADLEKWVWIDEADTW